MHSIRNDIWCVQLDVCMIRLADNQKELILSHTWPSPVSWSFLQLSTSSSEAENTIALLPVSKVSQINNFYFILKFIFVSQKPLIAIQCSVQLHGSSVDGSLQPTNKVGSGYSMGGRPLGNPSTGWQIGNFRKQLIKRYWQPTSTYIISEK